MAKKQTATATLRKTRSDPDRRGPDLQPSPAEMGPVDAGGTGSAGISPRPDRRIRLFPGSDRRRDTGRRTRLGAGPRRLPDLAHARGQAKAGTRPDRRRMQGRQRHHLPERLRRRAPTTRSMNTRGSSSPTTTARPSTGRWTTPGGCPTTTRSPTSPMPTRPTRKSTSCWRASRSSRRTNSPTCSTNATTSFATARSSTPPRPSTKSPRSSSSRFGSNGICDRKSSGKTSLPSTASTRRRVTNPLNWLFEQTKEAYADDRIFEADEEIRLKPATGREIVGSFGTLQPFRHQRRRQGHRLRALPGPHLPGRNRPILHPAHHRRVHGPDGRTQGRRRDLRPGQRFGRLPDSLLRDRAATDSGRRRPSVPGLQGRDRAGQEDLPKTRKAELLQREVRRHPGHPRPRQRPVRASGSWPIAASTAPTPTTAWPAPAR